MSSTTDGEETRYLVDANRPHARVLMEYDSNGTPIVEYTHGLQIISQEREGVDSLYHADGLGSTRFLTDSDGNITDTYIYDAYGKILSSSGSTENSYLYTGEQFDANLGEYYLRARYYDPSSGRFTARDPFEGFLSEPLSLAKYPYVHGNPINNTDPSGMFIAELNSSFAMQTILLVIAANHISSLLNNVTNTINPSIEAPLASVGNGIISIAELILSETAITACNLSKDSACSTFIPILFSGDMYKNQSIKETTHHIADAISKGKFSTLSSWAVQPPNHGRKKGFNKWYKKKPECNKDSYPDLIKGTLACDEYPFFSSDQGGEENYSFGQVSLKLVPESEAGPQGNLVDTKQKDADVRRGVPFYEWYGVVAISGLPDSFWRHRDGRIVG